MPAVRRITVELDEDLAAFVDRRIIVDGHADGESVVVDALTVQRVKELYDQLPEPSADTFNAMLRESIAEWDADPTGAVELEAAFAQLEAEWAADEPA